MDQEFNLESFYLDTLAFNPDTNAFVIIEYKTTQSWSLMDQGQTYLNLLLDHKADVLLAYNEKRNQNKKLTDIDWSQSRVIFISPSFTPYQKRALAPNFPFELWQVRLLENDLVELDQLQPIGFSRLSQTKPVLSGRASREIKVYTAEEVLAEAPTEQREWMEMLREKILALGADIQEKAGKETLSYKTTRRFVILWPHKDIRKGLEIYFHRGAKLNDPQRFLHGSGKFGRSFYVKSEKDIEQAFEFIKQAYQSAPDL
ncbi:MAG: DUF5655 domain-containing protein [Microgenomates group bacterium]